MTTLEVKANYFRRIYRLHLNDNSISLYTRVKKSYGVLKWLTSLGYKRSHCIHRLAKDMEIDSKAYGILLQHKKS